MTLKQKTISGVVWTGLAKMSMQGVLFVVTIILARLLTPDDFGIVGMAALVTVAVAMVNDRGLGTAIIQKRDILENQLSSVFWGGLVFAIVLFSISAMASFPVAAFFKKPVVQAVIGVQAFGFIIGAFGIVQKSLLTRDMEFKKLAIMEIASVAVSGCISIVMALLKFGVWSLVVGTLVRDLTGVILVWIYCDWRPKLHFSWPDFKSLFGFSANVLGNDVALYATTNVDITIIGKVLGSAPLGFYSLALNMVKLPVTRLSGIVSKVTFPAFSAVQEDLGRFKNGFTKSLTFISIFTFPLLAGMAVFSREFIEIFLGAKWQAMAAPLIILTPMAMLKSVGTIKGSVLMARGRPEIELWWNIVYLLPLAGVVLLGTRYGIVGVATAFTALYVITFPIIQGITNRQVDLSSREFLAALLPASVPTAVMVVFGLLLKQFAAGLFKSALLPFFISGVVLSVLVYLACLWLMDKSLFAELWNAVAHQGKQGQNLPSTAGTEVMAGS